jgi:arsenate reductase
MYQVIANAILADKVVAKSAGSQPADAVNKGALEALERHGYSTDGLYSKSWDELEDFAPDVIVTVCDSAAGETCPAWFGDSQKLHWSTRDPSAFEGRTEVKRQAFDETVKFIEAKLTEWAKTL